MKKASRALALCSALSVVIGGLTYVANSAHGATVSAQKNRSFAFQLFKSSASAHKGENVLVSPLSASLALGMVLNGASGENLKQMSDVLGVGNLDQFNARNKSVIASLNANKSVTMEVANAIYSDKKTPFKQSFIDFCKATYGAAAETLDFTQKEQTLATINSWSSQKTHGKIPKILSKLTEEDKMVLLNAIYFKGKWEAAFNKTATKDDDFTLQNGKKTRVKMMHTFGSFRYLEGEKFEAVALPYKGGKQSMYVFLPHEGVDIDSFQLLMTNANWSQWMSGFTTESVSVSMPKLRIDYGGSLKEILKSMGMKLAFMDSVPGLFKGLVTSPAKAGMNIPGVEPHLDFNAWISEVIQKTYMEVSEEGTEAAAVTAVVVAAVSPCVAPQPRIINFRADRPYVLALVDDETGEILFLGKVLKPGTGA